MTELGQKSDGARRKKESVRCEVLVLLAGACGFATLWAAVFADVGVALLVVLNSVRILRKKF